MGIPIIEVKNIKKNYTSFELEISSLKIYENDFVLLLGNNGSGKTTLLKLILDLTLPDFGNVLFLSKDVNKFENWKLITGAYIDPSFLIPYLTPREFLNLIIKFKNAEKDLLTNFLTKYEGFIEEKYLEKVLIKDLSMGNQQKVGIVSALVTIPKLVILDEPSSGLDPSSKEFFKEILLSFAKEFGTTIIISSHNLEDLNFYGSRLIVLEKGKILFDLLNNDLNKTKVNQYFKQRIRN
jgi:ABC-2 type transport system ATP-binding protein